MQRKFWIILSAALVCSLTSKSVYSQELNAQVQVLTPQIQATNKQVFTTLENSIREFLNNTRWTDEVYENNEKIACSFVINVTKWQVDQFEATLQVQYSRPIYRSGYASPVLVHMDNNFAFQYLEFDRLDFAKNTFISNLTSVLAFYAYVVIGLDHDTFAEKSGDPYYVEAQNIVSNAQNNGFSGWGSFENRKNRFWLLDNLQSPAFDDFKKALYLYHRKGLDLMYDINNHKSAKENIKAALMLLEPVNQRRPGAFLIQMFFDAKVNEIINIFGSGEPVPLADLKELLIKLDANNSSKYEQMGAG